MTVFEKIKSMETVEEMMLFIYHHREFKYSHLRMLLIEAARGMCRGRIGYKSKVLRSRQDGNPTEVIAYADRGNTRMRSKYYRMIRHGKKDNVAVAAVARELACFIWGLMTNNITPKEEGTKAA